MGDESVLATLADEIAGEIYDLSENGTLRLLILPEENFTLNGKYYEKDKWYELASVQCTVTKETNSTGYLSYGSLTVPYELTDKTLKLSEGSRTLTFTATDPVEVSIADADNTPLDVEAIDLGLPSGTKWANINVGAEEIAEFGDYFAWGETEPYYSSKSPLTWKTGKSEGYSWSSYFDNPSGDGETFIKYKGSKTTLDVEDDAASVNWSKRWRTPTKAQWEELLTVYPWSSTSGSKRCNWGTVQGVDGLVFYNATNDIVFFLPAGDHGEGAGLGNSKAGFYMESEIDGESIYSSLFIFFNKTSQASLGAYPRCFGYNVRPVLAE